MITHVVLLKPRADLMPAERQAFVAALRRAVREIPTVRRVRVGRRVRSNASYERTMPDTADFVALLDFDDEQGLSTYLHHPAHDALGQLFAQVAASALVYDFETGEIDWLDEAIASIVDGGEN